MQFGRLQAQSPALQLANARSRLEQLQARLQTKLKERIEQRRTQMNIAVRTLNALSPLATLTRGYAIVTDAQGHAVLEAGKLQAGDAIMARLSKGRLSATVNHVKPDEQ